ncbi:MAG: hypothetical protein ACK56I_11800, partial [bacterium]
MPQPRPPARPASCMRLSPARRVTLPRSGQWRLQPLRHPCSGSPWRPIPSLAWHGHECRMTSTTLNGMPTSLLAGLSLLLLAGAVVCWRTKSVPPHATIGILVLALILARKFVEDQAPTVST